MGWIGVDLDGTLAEWDGVWKGPLDIGKPIPKMVERVKGWLAEGKEVRIFTARVNSGSVADDAAADAAIQLWTFEYLGQNLQSTFKKDRHMIELWDDLAVQVEKNTGEGMENLLQNLLAVLHGDGGHYSAKHGLKKATEDAMEKYYGICQDRCCVR
jgi:hypothetical protein